MGDLGECSHWLQVWSWSRCLLRSRIVVLYSVPVGWQPLWMWEVVECEDWYGQVWSDFGPEDQLLLESAFSENLPFITATTRNNQNYLYDFHLMQQRNITSDNPRRQRSRAIQRVLKRPLPFTLSEAYEDDVGVIPDTQPPPEEDVPTEIEVEDDDAPIAAPGGA